jgi:hypothetical protein
MSNEPFSRWPVPYQFGNEPKQCLLLRAISLTEGWSDLDLGNMSSRRFHKHATAIRITCKIPTVSIRAVVKLSDTGMGPLRAMLARLSSFFGNARRFALSRTRSRVNKAWLAGTTKTCRLFRLKRSLQTEDNDANADISQGPQSLSVKPIA